jgi:hypothetical protein
MPEWGMIAATGGACRLKLENKVILSPKTNRHKSHRQDGQYMSERDSH